MGLTAEATAELKSGLEKTFKDFDADGSGEVSTTEIEAMMLSLGLLVQPETLKAMMKEADTDNSGEISFDEFFAVMLKQANDPAAGGPFAALVNRKSNCGPALKWDKDKMGKGCKVNDGDLRRLTKEGDGWGTQILDKYIKSGAGKDCHDACDVLLKCDKITGPCYFGIVGSNFTSFADEEVKDSNHAIVFSSQDGTVYKKKVAAGATTKLCAVQSGWTVQFEIRMQKNEIHITVLNEKNEIKGTCSIDSAITVCTFAVGFGPATEPFEVTLVGSSCEKTLSQDMDENEVVSNEKKAAADPTANAAGSLA